MVQLFELQAADKGIQLKSDLSPSLPMVAADIVLIERVLVNLIENAIRHTPAGGRVSLVCLLEHSDVRVEVSDTGPGISAIELRHIFDRFYRATGTGSGAEGSQGAGLGLAIAKRILDLHGSTLTVRSEPDAGATFAFALHTVDQATSRPVTSNAMTP